MRQHPRLRRSSDDSESESDPDDTTPLINPVENANNHGTFHNEAVGKCYPNYDI